MEPNRSPQATLNDLLDRLLDKGVMLNTDLIISVAGIPLIGVNLKLALAGMETMLEYGIMQDWDEAQRAVALQEKKLKLPLLELDKEEHIIFSVFGTHWYSKGIYNSWRAGTIYITNKKLIMIRKMPSEILLEINHEDIRAMTIKEKMHYTGEKRKELYISLFNDEIIQMHTKDTVFLKKTIEDILKEKGFNLEKNYTFPHDQDAPEGLLENGEEITHKGKMWYQMPYMSEGTLHYQWKPGRLFLTNKRLCWWYDFDQKLLLDIPVDKVVHVTIKDIQFGYAPIQEKSFLVLYKEETENKVACLSDNEASLKEWEKVIQERIKEDKAAKAACPKCGRRASREDLLENGCSRCGWVSHRVKK